MRIVIDLQGAQSDSRFRGIGRYTVSFTKALIEQAPHHDFFLVLNGAFGESIDAIRDSFYGVLPQDQICVWQPVMPSSEGHARNAWRTQVNQIIRKAFIANLKPDLIHISSLFEGFRDNAVTGIDGLSEIGTPISIMFYDLIPLLDPKRYLDPEPRFKDFYFKRIEQLKKANLLLGISEFSCRQAIDHLSMASDSVVNVSAASDLASTKKSDTTDLDAAALVDMGISKPFILYTGGGDSRKNIAGLIAAFNQLPEKIRISHQLVLSGHNIELHRHIKGLGLGINKQIIVTGYVSDKQLIALYQRCAVFVFPSFFEGFGLPPLEAMSFGAPTLASNTTSIPEVMGEHPGLFNPHAVDELSQKIERVLSDSHFRDQLIECGYAQAKKFSWYNSAKHAIEAFERVRQETPPTNPGVIGFDLSIENILDQIAAIDIRKPSDYDMLCCAQSVAQSFPPHGNRHNLFIDISELVQRDAGTGVQRVTRSILSEFLKNPPNGYEVKPVYATLSNRGYRHANKFLAKFEGRDSKGVADDVIEAFPNDIFLGLDLQHHTTRFQSDALKAMRRNGIFVCFVVYDLLPIQFPHFWPGEHAVKLVHENWLRVVCDSDAAIGISKAVADELEMWIAKDAIPHADHFKVSWFHLGANIRNSPTQGMPANADEIITQIQDRPSFLLVGTLEPRKGYQQVLDAFELLWGQGQQINLVIVGKKGWLVDELHQRIVSHAEAGKRLFWIDSASDEFLEKIYKNSTCLIAASFGEGFGLPLIEAAQHQIPIIARNLSVFKEVAAEAAYYFDGYAAKDLADAVLAWLRLYKDDGHPRSSQLRWQNWEDSAKQLWREVLRLKSKDPFANQPLVTVK